MGNKHKNQHTEETTSLGNCFDLSRIETATGSAPEQFHLESVVTDNPLIKVKQQVRAFCLSKTPTFSFWEINFEQLDQAKKNLGIPHVAKYWLNQFLHNVACNLWSTYLKEHRQPFGENDRQVTTEAEAVFQEFCKKFE